MSAQSRKYKVTKPGKPLPSPKPIVEARKSTAHVIKPGSGSRKFRVTTPGRVIDNKQGMQSVNADKQITRGGRKYRVVTPTRAKAEPTVKRASPKTAKTPGQRVSAKPAAVSSVGGRAVTKSTPGTKRRGQVARQVSRTVTKTAGRRSSHTRGKRTGGIRAGKTAKKPPESIDDMTGNELIVLRGFGKGPLDLMQISKRTGLPQSKIIPIAKELEARSMVLSKKIGKVQKFKLSLRAQDLLHPPSALSKLFNRKRGRRRGRRISRRQRIKRYDYAILSILVIIISLMIAFIFLYFQLVKTIDEQELLPDITDDGQDIVEPVIIWDNPIESIDNQYDSLSIVLRVFDNGTPPISGVNFNTLRVQYAFASSNLLSRPDLTNWSWVMPSTIPPQASITLSRDWVMYSQKYIFVRCTVEDFKGNLAIETYKIRINL